MDWLLHNPIADMSGPQFLAFFAIVIGLALVASRRRVRAVDSSSGAPPYPIPAKIDPYEVAWMRGGEPEMLRLAVLDLIQRGFLRHREEKPGGKAHEELIERASRRPDSAHLLPMERAVFELFGSPRTAEEIMRSGRGVLAPLAEQQAAKLVNDQLALAPDEIRAIQKIVRWSALLILALGAYKLCVALSRGHQNVIFLILMTIGAIIALFVMYRPFQPHQLSARGREYLAQLRIALAQLKDRVRLLTATRDPALLLAVGTFGIGVLEASDCAYYPKMFKKAAQQEGSGGCSSSSTTSCGSSCNASSDSSGSSSDSGGGDSGGGGDGGGSSCGGGGGCGGCGS